MSKFHPHASMYEGYWELPMHNSYNSNSLYQGNPNWTTVDTPYMSHWEGPASTFESTPTYFAENYSSKLSLKNVNWANISLNSFEKLYIINESGDKVDVTNSTWLPEGRELIGSLAIDPYSHDNEEKSMAVKDLEFDQSKLSAHPYQEHGTFVFGGFNELKLKHSHGITLTDNGTKSHVKQIELENSDVAIRFSDSQQKTIPELNVNLGSYSELMVENLDKVKTGEIRISQNAKLSFSAKHIDSDRFEGIYRLHNDGYFRLEEFKDAVKLCQKLDTILFQDRTEKSLSWFWQPKKLLKHSEFEKISTDLNSPSPLNDGDDTTTLLEDFQINRLSSIDRQLHDYLHAFLKENFNNWSQIEQAIKKTSALYKLGSNEEIISGIYDDMKHAFELNTATENETSLAGGMFDVTELFANDLD